MGRIFAVAMRPGRSGRLRFAARALCAAPDRRGNQNTVVAHL